MAKLRKYLHFHYFFTNFFVKNLEATIKLLIFATENA